MEMQIEDRLVDTVGEGKSGKSGASSINIYTLPCVNQRAGEKLLYNTGSPDWRSVMAQRGGMGGGTKTQEGGDICIIMADFFVVQQKATQHCKAIFLQ